jgi:zinc transport system ATP-binding protein
MNKRKLIELQNVGFSYGKHAVLESIDLSIHEHDFWAILGPNGGGKTTLLKVILKLLKPDSGKVIYHDRNIMNSIGYVPQTTNFDRQFPIRVHEIVSSGMLSRDRIGRKMPKQANLRVKEMLHTLHIEHLETNHISQLSGGQLQRILIARALITEPKLLILDEPTSFIDTSSRDRLSELLAELNKSITIILVSHDIGAIYRNVKQIACLNKKMHCHTDGKLTKESIEKVYGCPVDMITHGVPHRVLDPSALQEE